MASRPIILTGSLGNPDELVDLDVRWWLQASPGERVAGVDQARRDWLKMTAAEGGSCRVQDSNRDFEDLFRLLNEKGVRYLVVGGYAVAHHSGPRFTKDIDLLVEASPQNARHLLAALTAFIGDPGISEWQLSKPDTIVMLGVPPTRIDLLTGIPGVVFQEAWGRRSPGRYGDQDVPFLGLDDLISAKEASGRPQDLVDADRLRRARRLG